MHSIATSSILALACALPQFTHGDAQTSLTGQVELARLIDLGVTRLGISVTYDPMLLKGAVTVRSDDSLTDQQLWEMAMRLLAERGLTTVQAVSDGPHAVSVVKITDALALAQVQEAANDDSEFIIPAYISVTKRLHNQLPKLTVEALKQMVSKPGGAITEVGSGNVLLISDLTPRVKDLLRIIALLDAVPDAPVIERIATQHVAVSQIVPLVTAAATAGDAMANVPRRGKVVGSGDASSIVLICPQNEVAFWRQLIERFDQRQPVTSQNYSARHFGAVDVGRLIEQVARDHSPRGSGDQWRLVADDLTTTLVVTATVAEHAEIAALIKRLDSMPMEARRPMRAFVIRNRSVTEILEVLTSLLDAGVLDSSTAPEEPTESTQQPLSGAPEPVAPPGSSTMRSTLPRETTPTLVAPVPASPPKSSTTTPGPDRRAQLTQRAIFLTADEGTNTLIATADARLLKQLEDLIRKLDVRQPQVMIEVMIVSLSDNDTLDLGVELRKIELSGSTAISLSSLFGLGTPPSGIPSSINARQGFSGVVLSPGDFSVVVRALQTTNRGRVLSLPKVLVNNNQQATLNSVLQQPFISVNASDTIATTSFGGTDNAGTIITIKPQIAEGDHLLLQYSVSLSAFVGDAVDPSVPPPKQSNNLSSLVTIADGYTIVVGGLEVTNESRGVSQIPLIGDIPLIGEAFKNRSITSSRTRFFVFIRSDVLRHTSFEDLKYLSDRDVAEAEVDDGWPKVEPRVIR